MGRVNMFGGLRPRADALLSFVSQIRRDDNERGSALVEFALSAVILLTLVFGVISMSLAIYSYHYISDAAREATRYAIVRGSECNNDPPSLQQCPATADDVQNYVHGLSFPGIHPNLMTVSTSWPNSGVSCTPSVAPCNNPGNLVHVTVTYTLPVTIPFVPTQTLTMTSTSEMVISD